MLSAIQGGGLKALKKAPQKKKEGGGRGDLLAEISAGAKLRSTKKEVDPADAVVASGGGGAGGGGKNGAEGGGEYGPPWNKKPPSNVAGDSKRCLADIVWLGMFYQHCCVCSVC